MKLLVIYDKVIVNLSFMMRKIIISLLFDIYKEKYNHKLSSYLLRSNIKTYFYLKGKENLLGPLSFALENLGLLT